MSLRDIKKSVGSLPLGQLLKLDGWLHELISAVEAEQRAGATAGGVKRKGRQTSDKTYCLERVRCGKEGCKCARGQLHGPYWYAYWTEGGKTKSQYIGKSLPKSLKRSAPRRVR